MTCLHPLHLVTVECCNALPYHALSLPTMLGVDIRLHPQIVASAWLTSFPISTPPAPQISRLEPGFEIGDLSTWEGSIICESREPRFRADASVGNFTTKGGRRARMPCLGQATRDEQSLRGGWIDMEDDAEHLRL